METTIDMTRATTIPAPPEPCLWVDGEKVYPADIITPAAYEAAWRSRKPGRRVEGIGYHFARYVSVRVESDCGVEIELSALVDLRPGGKSDVDDYRCRLAPDGAEVELDDATIEGQRQRLIDAAVELAR